ncbi:hypothetical protein M501DRAFT_1002826 [Patellaria atrata CBS 101060]|uniref:Nascent polypeptide-associated complex subunit alpha-like UBA domain-containing protein n=1 Tax=Patellaria atrata CBS 101060 TaxID=1346257 RepID=A0A9P4SET5_9PEZI|nr:hypothetical protein M501DRAFT_1002826 [Patellaria atrata CBS 101060]
MAEEPQPSNITAGAEDTPSLPSNAEDRKAAAALSALDTRGADDDAGENRKNVDSEALGQAMKNLDLGKEGKKDEEVKKVVKVDAGDVKLLVEQLELSKVKATELLKAHDGHAVRAMVAFVQASA